MVNASQLAALGLAGAAALFLSGRGGGSSGGGGGGNGGGSTATSSSTGLGTTSADLRENVVDRGTGGIITGPGPSPTPDAARDAPQTPSGDDAETVGGTTDGGATASPDDFVSMDLVGPGAVEHYEAAFPEMRRESGTPWMDIVQEHWDGYATPTENDPEGDRNQYSRTLPEIERRYKSGELTATEVIPVID